VGAGGRVSSTHSSGRSTPWAPRPKRAVYFKRGSHSAVVQYDTNSNGAGRTCRRPTNSPGVHRAVPRHTLSTSSRPNGQQASCPTRLSQLALGCPDIRLWAERDALTTVAELSEATAISHCRSAAQLAFKEPSTEVCQQTAIGQRLDG